MTNNHKPTLTLTKEGVEELKNRLTQLKKERPQLVERLARARSFGDLSENSEYTSAKEALSFLDNQISELEAVLQVSKVVKKRRDVAGLGSRLTLKTGEKQLTITLVSHWEANPLEKKISIDSPLGQALQGRKLKEVVKVSTPQGERSYQIVKIE